MTSAELQNEDVRPTTLHLSNHKNTPELDTPNNIFTSTEGRFETAKEDPQTDYFCRQTNLLTQEMVSDSNDIFKRKKQHLYSSIQNR